MKSLQCNNLCAIFVSRSLLGYYSLTIKIQLADPDNPVDSNDLVPIAIAHQAILQSYFRKRDKLISHSWTQFNTMIATDDIQQEMSLLALSENITLEFVYE